MSRAAAGTWCAECFAAGHHCQAQLVLEEQPLCLDCADGEPCGVQRAAAAAPEPPKPLLVERAVHQPLEEEQVSATVAVAQAKPPALRFFANLSPAEQEQFRGDVLTGSAGEVAAKYGVDQSTIYNYKKKWGAPARVPGPKKPAPSAAIVRPPQAPVIAPVGAEPPALAAAAHVAVCLQLSPGELDTLFALLPPVSKIAALKFALGAL